MELRTAYLSFCAANGCHSLDEAVDVGPTTEARADGW